MQVFNTTGVCTAYQIHNFGNFMIMTPENKLKFLKSDPSLLQLCRAMDFDLIWSINTADQMNDNAFRELGFTESFAAPKSHEKCRHKESGTLKMWCIQPWVLEENRLKKINELEGNAATIPEEEKRRRLSFPEFALYKARKEQTYIDRFPDAPAIKMEDRFPTGLVDRRNFFSMVSSMTGGYDIAHDPVIISNISSLTWGNVKQRAIMYRNSEI